jgi:hypothetical protein
VITLYYLVWIALLWLLHAPRGISLRIIAFGAMLLGVVPRVLILIAEITLASLLNAVTWILLIAFGLLTLLWLAYLGGIVCKRPTPRLASPMLILAAIEFLPPITRISASWTFHLQLVAQLAYCAAQFAFLAAKVRENQPPPPQWSRL